VVTHPEGGARASFSEQQLKSENQGRKAGRNPNCVLFVDSTNRLLCKQYLAVLS
jgi:hypothetical protein